MVFPSFVSEILLPLHAGVLNLKMPRFPPSRQRIDNDSAFETVRVDGGST